MLIGRLTLEERMRKFRGATAPPCVWVCRCLWFALACWTMSMHGTEVYVAPHYWLIFVALYYFYFD
jgi:hypothetical protein